MAASLVPPIRLTRRDAMRLVGADAGLTLLGAHSPMAAAQASPGGTLRIGVPADLVRPDPNVLGAANGFLARQVFSAVVRYDAEFQPQPELAERSEWTSNHTRLTLGHQQGVQSHDGEAFTSEDVRYTIERVRDPELGAFQLKIFSDAITDIQTPDASTVVLGFAQPQPATLDILLPSPH